MIRASCRLASAVGTGFLLALSAFRPRATVAQNPEAELWQKRPPPVTREMAERVGDFVQTRRLFLFRLHARLAAFLTREGLRPERTISRREIEFRRLRQFTAVDTARFRLTVTIVGDPDETAAQLEATCYVLLAAEHTGIPVTRGTEHWPRLVRMAEFLSTAQARYQ